MSPTRFKDSLLEKLKSLCGITIDNETFKNLIVKSIKVCSSEIVVYLFLRLFLLFVFEVQIGLLDDH